MPDDILDRMKNVTLEEAWATLRNAGFNHQYEDGWYCIHPDQVLVGRALTSMWMPGRPDIQKEIEAQGKRIIARAPQMRGRWICCSRGTSMSRTTSSSSRTGRRSATTWETHLRVIRQWHRLQWRCARHQRPERVAELHFFRPLLRSIPPLWIACNRTAAELHDGEHQRSYAHWHATVMPGDVVLGRNGGVLFIPPQLAERVVKESERTHLEDMFGHQRLREKKYTAGQIDARWSPEIEQDYHQWLKENEDRFPAPKSTIEEILKENTN